MTRSKFCPACGERLAAKRSFPFLIRACGNCASRFRRFRLLTACALAFCLSASFAIGRYTRQQKPFHFIGTPLDPGEIGPVPLGQIDRAGRPDEPAPEAISPVSAALDRPCGARTRSGRPCKRKVRGGGRCWQHRAG